MKGSGLDSDARLPRGPHRLPRDIVAAHQRERMLASAAEAVAEHGYASLSVRHVIERANVSRATFYDQFENKHECLIAAYDAAFERLMQVIFEACAYSSDWPSGVAAAVAAALDFASGHPGEAQLLVIAQGAIADPRLFNHAIGSQEALIRLLHAGREHREARSEPMDLTEQAMLGAAMSVVGARLHADRLDALALLKPELTQLILTPYVGGAEAARVARRRRGSPTPAPELGGSRASLP